MAAPRYVAENCRRAARETQQDEKSKIHTCELWVRKAIRGMVYFIVLLWEVRAGAGVRAKMDSFSSR